MKLGYSVEPKWLPDSLALIVYCLSFAQKKGGGRRGLSNLDHCCFPAFRSIDLKENEREKCGTVCFTTSSRGGSSKLEYQEKKDAGGGSSSETMETKLGHCTNFVLSLFLI